MRRRIPAAWVALLLLICDIHLSAQSLGDVARREAERRKQVTSGRVYTNGNLVAVDAPQPPPAQAVVAPAGTADASGEGTQAPGKDATPATGAAAPDAQAKKPIKAREKRDEQYWRARAKDLRGRLARANADLEGTESRLGEIDAGPQTAATAREREVVAKALARLQSDARFLRDEVTQFEARAASQKIPPDWIR